MHPPISKLKSQDSILTLSIISSCHLTCIFKVFRQKPWLSNLHSKTLRFAEVIFEDADSGKCFYTDR